MLPPPPASRQASYAYNLPRRASSNRRLPSLAPSHYSQHPPSEYLREDDDGDDEEAVGFEGRLEMEEGLEGMSEERGLEETLEKLGFGAYHWRLLALCGFGWMSDNSALQCIGEGDDHSCLFL